VGESWTVLADGRNGQELLHAGGKIMVGLQSREPGLRCHGRACDSVPPGLQVVAPDP
jgi:hypothetical protein